MVTIWLQLALDDYVVVVKMLLCLEVVGVEQAVAVTLLLHRTVSMNHSCLEYYYNDSDRTMIRCCRKLVMLQLPLKYSLAVGFDYVGQCSGVELGSRLCLTSSWRFRLRIVKDLVVVRIFHGSLGCVVSFGRISLLINL